MHTIARLFRNSFHQVHSGNDSSRAALWLLTLLGCCAAPSFAQTVFLNFNSVGQYTNNFNPWNDAGGFDGGNYSFMESPTAGVGGSGGVSVFQSNDTTAAYNGSSWDFSTNGATIILSVLLKANGQSSGNKVQLGILNTDANGLNNNAGVAFESFRFVPAASTIWSLREQYRTGNTTPIETALGNVTIMVGHWYKFVVSLTNTAPFIGSGDFDAACAIYDYGVDGQIPGGNIVVFSTLQSQSGQDIAVISSVWPALRAFQDGGVDAWDNFLVYATNSLPVITLPLTNTSVAVGNPATFNVLADGPGDIAYAWYTNGILAGGATGSTYTTPSVTSAYTNVVVVASNGNGSSSNSAAISVFVPAPAVVTNVPASNIAPTSATLNGKVLATGGDAPAITLYYGTTDGGLNAQAWSNSVALGVQSGAFAETVTGLSVNTTYFFAAKAVNAAGEAWATPSLGFATPPVTLAVVTNLPATNVQATLARLNGQVLDTGNDATTVTLYYGTADGGTNAGAWARSVALGLQTGSFAQTVTGLSSNTPYFYTAKAVNAAGAAWARPSQTFTTSAADLRSSAVAVLTQHNDNGRTGMNLNETILNTGNVNPKQFGLVFTRAVDDQIYAQPLVMTNVSILGKGTHNLVIVATVNDTLYAFEADDPAIGRPYWTNSFINPPNIVAPRNSDMTGACGGGYQDFSGKLGIVGAPVIDPASGTLYVVARTKEFGTSYVQKLHALDVVTGVERPNSPVVIAATNGVVFDPYKQNQRPALTLANGMVYIAWSSHCDWTPYHGWVIGYNAANLLQAPISYNATPSGSQAGIWMSNQGPAADSDGNLYLSTGNGTFDGVDNFGESFLRLTPSGNDLTLTSWFTPYNYDSLNGADADLGSGGVLLIPGTTLLLSGGKSGPDGSVLYLVNRDNMGGISSSGTVDDNIVQSWGIGAHSIHGGPVWWDGPNGSFAYIWAASSDSLRQYQFSNGLFDTNGYAQSTTIGGGGQPGGILALSANGATAGSGVVWASINTTANANQATVAGTLHAYNAQDVGTELWNSDMVSARDSLGNFAKFVAPTVVNGKVYMATFSNRLNVYGLLPQPSLSIARSGNSAVLSWPASVSTSTYTLQSTTNLLLSDTWSNAINTVVTTNGLFQVTVPATGPAMFYRLKLY